MRRIARFAGLSRITRTCPVAFSVVVVPVAVAVVPVPMLVAVVRSVPVPVFVVVCRVCAERAEYDLALSEWNDQSMVSVMSEEPSNLFHLIVANLQCLLHYVPGDAVLRARWDSF